MDRIKNYFIRPWNSTAMLSVDPIPRFVMEHLFMVYCTLFYCFVFILSGATSHLLFNNGGWVSALGFIGSVWWISRIKPWREIRRVLFLMTASYFAGATFGPLINLIIEIDQRNVVKIIMGGILFFSCYLGAVIHRLDRSVIYGLGEYSAPIIITAWMVLSDTYPGLFTDIVSLLSLPIQWYLVIHMGGFLGRRLRLWFNPPIHLAWITLLSYCFDHSIHDLMYVYVILLWLIVHMKMYTQLVIFRAAHHTDENYYVSTAITFFTEFPVLVIAFFRHNADVRRMRRASAARRR